MANTFLGNIAAAELWNGDSSAGIPLSGDVLLPCSIKKHKNAAGFYYEEKWFGFGARFANVLSIFSTKRAFEFQLII